MANISLQSAVSPSDTRVSPRASMGGFLSGEPQRTGLELLDQFIQGVSEFSYRRAPGGLGFEAATYQVVEGSRDASV